MSEKSLNWNRPPYWTPGLTIIIDLMDWLAIDAAISRFGFFVELGPVYFELAWWAGTEKVRKVE